MKLWDYHKNPSGSMLVRKEPYLLWPLYDYSPAKVVDALIAPQHGLTRLSAQRESWGRQ